MTVSTAKKRERLTLVSDLVKREYERTGRNAYEQFKNRMQCRPINEELHRRINARGIKSWKSDHR